MAGEVLRHAAMQPATVLYPVVPAEMPENFRGKIVFLAERCSGCNLCVKDCPSGAIAINKVGNKRFEAVFDLDRCIYCAQCVDSCNRDALAATKEFELAAFNRPSLRLVFHAPEAPPETPEVATAAKAAPETPAAAPGTKPGQGTA
jgi:formate hydrogenlyase subunit 6/NADH:ubiquinone oxidoreductase subunit I